MLPVEQWPASRAPLPQTNFFYHVPFSTAYKPRTLDRSHLNEQEMEINLKLRREKRTLNFRWEHCRVNEKYTDNDNIIRTVFKCMKIVSHKIDVNKTTTTTTKSLNSNDNKHSISKWDREQSRRKKTTLFINKKWLIPSNINRNFFHWCTHARTHRHSEEF